MNTRLQDLRKRAGYRSAKAYAEHLGIKVGTYTDYEQGRTVMSLERAWYIADDLDCTLDELAGRDFHPDVGAQPPEVRELAEIYQDANAQGRAAIMAVARSQSGVAQPPATGEVSEAG